MGSAAGNAAPEFFANANAWTLLGGTVALSAGIVVGGYAIGAAALPAGVFGSYAGLAGAVGGTAGFYNGLLQTYAADPNAGLGAYALGGGLGGAFGAFVPGGGVGGLAGSLGGGVIGSAFGDTNMGVQFGGLAGDLLGGGLAAGSRRAALTNLAYQGAGAGIGALAGGRYYGNARGALFGANLGAFGGGITQSGVGLYRGWRKVATSLGRQNPMFKHALQPFRGGFSNAGRALSKHPNIVGAKSAQELIQRFGNNAGINKAAADALKSIMRNGTRTTRTTKAFGDVVTFKLPNGLGARFSAVTNEFIGFLGRGL